MPLAYAPQIARADWPHCGSLCTDLQQHMRKQHHCRKDKLTRSRCPWSLSNLFAYCSVPVAGYCCISLLMALCPWQVIVVSRCPWLYAMIGVYCNFLLKALRHGMSMFHLSAHGLLLTAGHYPISLHMALCQCQANAVSLCPSHVNAVSLCSWLCAHGRSLSYLSAHGRSIKHLSLQGSVPLSEH